MNDTMTAKVPLIVSALRGEKTTRTPVWLMRQAGRYLPEYRDLRAKAGGFLAMAYDPELAAEITLQPIRRFGMDGAILFSDILVIPHALGQDLRFEAGEGPRLGALDIAALNADGIDETLKPVYDALRLIRGKLDGEGFTDTALIGFCGGLWTVACYMVEGGGSKDFSHAKAFAYGNPAEFQKLIDVISAASIHYLSKQAEAGAQVLQIFESWAGVLDAQGFADWVIAPTKKIVSALKEKFPHVPVIGFPRGATLAQMENYIAQTGVDGVGCDFTHTPQSLQSLQQKACVQGNLDPAALLAGGARMEQSARTILDNLAGKPFIFNLGHGVIKETDPANVDSLIKLVQGYRA